MTKLSGTSGQLFSGLAESLNMRGASRSTKGGGTKSQADSSFKDLLHTVSSLAKKALNDEGGDTSVKAGSLRTRLVHPIEKDGTKDETVRERAEAADEPKSSRKPSDQKTEPSSQTQSPVDHAAKVDVPDRSSVLAMVGQEFAAVPAKPQMQSQAAAEKDAPARDERSTTKRDVQATGMARAAVESAPMAAAPTGARSQVTSSQATAAEQGSDASSKAAMPGTSGFEAVTANVERAVKASARDALPEATKVTVVQQETHLPPAQFNAPQQIANAVVAELKESPAPPASTAPDLATSQSNTPDQPLKILTINLEPPALGNVTVRLRLVGTEVSVHLAAERKDTSQMLDQQRDSIRDLMQSAGYVADVAPVQHGSLDGFQSGSGQSQPQPSSQQQPQSQSHAAFDGTSTSSGQSDGGAKQARQERQSNQETRHDQDVGPQNRRGPVYL
ncbi:flagellar hook-length control protein FliK [Bradyrhizobium cajani]|uniref:Flagellar hook-length control protein FliK n=1 Tax=Bradyrhizobium cajani TaxID=1928661 RepID=A0A844TC72_9BRAD|nr:flagellar hook-length control protein FliK [Bradyrhizobium cajani]MCP3371994.1 flagellar hook-length control protein FliK [Bradyrhizobium cajani]MVT72220.1 flagellar hook-length control protein FliK [Bradyrhizobium cajani]